MIYATGVDGVALDNHEVSTLQFSSYAAPLSCTIYNKTREIKQKSNKTFFYDLWKKGFDGPYGGSWDGESDVWRVEFRFKRAFLHQLKQPIEGAYVMLDIVACSLVICCWLAGWWPRQFARWLASLCSAR